MGILKVGVGAAQGVLADSWREYFYCDAMDVDVLAKKASSGSPNGDLIQKRVKISFPMALSLSSMRGSA